MLKERIKKNRLMKYPLLIRKYLKHARFREWIDAYGKPNAIYFHEYGKENPDANIYYMQFDDAALGFFGYWKIGIRGLNYADFYHLQPVIDWTKSSPYYEPNLFGEESNPFEYYFEPINNISLKSVGHSKSVVVMNESNNQIGVFAKDIYGFSSQEFNQQIKDYVKIHRKYFHIKKDLKSNLETQINELFCEKKVVGVHIRGVEWGTILNHPMPIALERYYEWIDFSMKEYGFERIFIASDSEDTLSECRARYGHIMMTFEDTLRSRAGSKTLMLFDKSISRKNNHYLMGYEILRDMLALSKCNGLIAGLSNVSLAARVFKESENGKYEFLKIIEPDTICTHGISTSKAVKQMRQGKFDRKGK